MNQQTLKFGVIVLVIITSILSFSLKFWADGELYKIEGPSFFRITPDNELSILQQHQLILTNSYGDTNRHIDLDSEGINNQGDYDFFSNGDLLIYHREYKKIFLENIARFLRLKEFSNHKPVGIDGLYRCNSYGRVCQLFSEELPAFDSAFRLLIDRETDTVYVADTPRFKLYKLDSQGNILAKKDKGFKFPNQLFLNENKLYVANTNLHEIAVLDTTSSNFGEKLHSHTAKINNTHKWPSQLTFSGNNWWVVIMDNGMQDGLIRVYDTLWNEILQPELPAKADPVGLIYFNEKIYISDWSHYAIYRFSYDGTRLEDFKNPDLEVLFTQSKAHQQHYRNISLISMISFAAVLCFGIFSAWKLEKKQTIDVLTGKNNLPSFDKTLEELESTPGSDIYWLESRHKKRSKFLDILMAIIFVMLAVSYIMLIVEAKKNIWQLHAMMLGMLIFTPYIYQQWRKILNVKIGVQGNTLFIDNGFGVILSGSGKQIKYNQGAFSINGHVALLGAPHQRFYEPKDLDKWIIPRFQQGEVLKQLELLKMLWHEKHPIVHVTLATMILMIAMYLVTLC